MQNDPTSRPVPEATVGGLTHLIMGISLSHDGLDRCAPTPVDRSAMDYLQALKRESPSLHVLLGLDGSTDAFRAAVSDPARRANLLASCTTLLQDRGFDGFDVDWEFPQSEADKQAFVALMREVRVALDALARGRLDLSMATSSSLPSFAFYDWSGLDPAVDWYNVMTYEYGPLFRTALNTPLHRPSHAMDEPTAYSIDDTLALYADAHVPPTKMNLGLAFYGHLWEGVAPEVDGLYQHYDTPANGRWAYIDYRDIAARDSPDSHHLRDDAALVPYLYEPATRTMISYDDGASLTAKVDEAQRRGIGGVMIFRVEQDDASSTLFESVYAALLTP